MSDDDLDRRVEEELDREERSGRALDLKDTGGRDHAIAIGTAALQAVPGIGPVLATLLSEYIPRRREERVAEFVRELEKALLRVETRIDRDRVLTDSFADTVEEVLERVHRAASDGKRAYYAAAVANTLVYPDLAADERERLMDALDDLRPANLRLLALLAENPPPPPDFNIVMGGIYSYLETVLPGLPEAQIRMDWEDLSRLNLADSYPSGTMSKEGLTNTRGRLSDFGRRFIAWITVPEKPPA